ncbi:MAG TPA: zinc-ribbon domain-containing protein [Gemmatimonadaceae bacterium]|nr:zinc-ribbon domain-containing protein [Gemmatimonadaceae bacterium]
MNVSCPDCRSIFRVDPAKVPPAGVRARCSVCSGVISIPAPTGQNTPPSGSERASSSPSDHVAARSTPTAQSGWDTAPYAPSSPRPAAPPPPPSRNVDTPASPRPRPEAIDRSTAAATATPPSPAAVLPEFTPPPPLPPFRPAGATPFPAPSAPPSPAPAAPPFVPSASRSTTPPRPAPTPPRPAQAAASTSPAATSDAGARRPLNPFLSKDPNQRAKRLARALVSDIITYHPAKHAEGLRDGTLKQLFREEIKKSFEEYIAQVGQQLAESTTYFQEALNEVLGAGKKIF